MLIIKPFIFNNYPEIIFAFSTKPGLNRITPYFFNMSYSVDDERKNVEENRKAFFEKIGLNPERISYQKQIHGDIITKVNTGGNCGESDALITTEKNLGLPKNKVIAAVHSGWRGTVKKILDKTLQKLKKKFNTNPSDLVCYIGPSVSQTNYEVGSEVAEQFDKKYIKTNNNRFYLNVAGINYDILLRNGIKAPNIQLSNLCTFEYSNLLHSYRRDGLHSGRASGIIAMKENP
jgi:YfiH family protein